jgi:hypothetical protein
VEIEEFPQSKKTMAVKLQDKKKNLDLLNLYPKGPLLSDILQGLIDAVRRKKRDKDNLLAHSSLWVSQFLKGNATLAWAIYCSLLLGPT